MNASHGTTLHVTVAVKQSIVHRIKSGVYSSHVTVCVMRLGTTRSLQSVSVSVSQAVSKGRSGVEWGTNDVK